MKNLDILNFISLEGKTFKEISTFFKIKDLKVLNSKLRELINNGEIYYKNSSDSFFLKDKNEFIGIFKDTKNEYGFIETDEKSYFVPAKFRLNALEGDTVKFKVLQKRNEDDKGDIAKILRVLKRNGSNIIGTIKEISGEITFVPDENYLKYQCILENPSGFKDGEVVIAKFFDFRNNIVYFKIVSKISEKRDPKFDWLIVANKFNLNLNFSQEALNDAKKSEEKIFKISRKLIKDQLIVTIDGDDSKDLDDAISIKKLENNNFLLSVHIADVSFFLEKDSQLDYEAYQRGTSVYLIDKVIPMLPEFLSNGLCSLNPNVEKLCLSVDIEIDHNGNFINIRPYESKIVSNYRLTYNEVDAFLEKPNIFLRDDKNLSQMLLIAKELSKILRLKKLKEGMIDFKLSEIKVSIDSNGFPINIYQKLQTESEKIIEDMMVAANESIALFLQRKHIKTLFRVHAHPSRENLEIFYFLSKSFGLTLMKDVDLITNKDLMNIVIEMTGKPYEFILKRFLIQTMEKAKYTSENLGHYALGLENYLHFTSPIRRYPDVIVHRTLRKYIFENKPILSHDFDNLEAQGKWCTEKEINSMQVERKLNDIKKARFLKSKIGESFTGIISSIMSYGIFIELDVFVQGMISLEQISDIKENIFFDPKTKTLHDKKTNIFYRIGDKVIVVLKEIDEIKGNVSFSNLSIET